MRRKVKPKAKRYVIRKLEGVAYAEAIAAMMLEGFGPQDGTRATAFIAVTWWGAFDAATEKLVGVGGMCHSGIEENTCYLNRSFVSPDVRGAGLQKKLIKARVDRARELGCEYATSDTYNEPYSTNNLIACGFRAYWPEQRWRGDDGVVYWRLRL